MSDKQTPIEGKGNEMIPNRGIPFEEVESEPTAENAEEAGGQAQPEGPDESAPFDEAALEAPAFDASETTEAPLPEMAAADESASEMLLELDEILARANELAEDAQTLPPDFAGELEEGLGEDFSAARTPAPLPEADREAILQESLEQPPEIDLDEVELPDEPPPVELDGGSGAGFPIPEEELAAMPGEPATEMPIPPPEAARGMPLFSPDALELPGPVSEAEEEKAPQATAGLKARKKMLDLLVPNKRVEALWERGDKLQTMIFDAIDDLNLARSLLEQVRSARTLILADKENYEEAERALNEVEYRITYGVRFKHWSGLGYRLMIYEVVWMFLLGFATFLLLRAGVRGLNLDIAPLISANEIYVGILGALFGGLGGVTGALYALWRYITQQKFNPQYTIWYLEQPIMGILIGLFIFIFLKIGFSVTAGSTGAEIGSPFMACLLGFIGGYQQNVLYNIVRQILQQFKIGQEEEKSQEEEQPIPGQPAL